MAGQETQIIMTTKKNCAKNQTSTFNLLLQNFLPVTGVIGASGPNVCFVLKTNFNRENATAFRCQFHQHFLRAFFVRKSFWQLFLTYEKGANLMLMKLTTGVYFTNDLLAAFVLADPKSTKRHR